MPQDIIVLVVEGQQLHLSFVGDSEPIFTYIDQMMNTEQKLYLKDTQNKTRAIFRGNKIIGAYLSSVDNTTTANLLRLQIENLQLQNKQLKTQEHDERWRG